MKPLAVTVSFKATMSLPGYNSIGIELGETCELEDGENPEDVRAELFASLKSKVQEYLIASTKKKDKPAVAPNRHPGHVAASPEAHAYLERLLTTMPDGGDVESSQEERFGR